MIGVIIQVPETFEKSRKDRTHVIHNYWTAAGKGNLREIVPPDLSHIIA